MAQTDHLKRVLSPLTIRGLQIKNRVVRTAHATAFADGPISDQLVAYHLERAEGSVVIYTPLCTMLTTQL